jgi:DNA-binding NarL/FixJ family response regulator
MLMDNVNRDTFLVVVRRVMDGLGPVVAGFPSVNEPLDAALVDEGPVSLLTPREREMLYLIGQGLSNREIAESLVLSVKTVEAHRANLSRKLNVRSRAGLMRLALTGSLA